MSYREQISIRDFNKICRVCLSNEKIRPKESIFNIKELLKYCLELEIKEDDLLPQNFCENCVSEMENMYRFKKDCYENESFLRLLLEEAQDHEKKVIKIRTKLLKCTFKYKCRNCSQIFKTGADLKEHRKRTQHPANMETRTHSCTICRKMFTGSKLRQHMRSHTKEKPYKCDICTASFSMSGNLKRHIMTHTGERPHVCKICGKGFIQATSLQSHEKTHMVIEGNGRDDEKGRFICSFCGRCFKRLAPFNQHLKKHDPNLKLTNEEENNAQQTEAVKLQYCDICNKGFKSKHLLKAHQLTHGEKSFLCSDCGKGFVTKAALQSHLKVHTGEKPHTCVVCSKSFAHVGSFESHMLIHSGQKPYSCNYCPKAFTQLSHLTYHLRTHSGERPYSCSYCGKCFALKGNLTVHVRTHTGETPYLCTICGKGFYDSSSMKKHKRNHKDDDFIIQAPPTQTLNIIVPQEMAVSEPSREENYQLAPLYYLTNPA